MKITIYTVTDCQFSKQEKEYLSSHNLQFEEKNLETNREYLTEMLTVGNNFAGTPVTKIEKEDGQIVVLKGFTKEEFDKTLGFGGSTDAGMATPPAPMAMDTPTMSQPTPPTPAPVQPVDPVMPPAPAPMTSPEPIVPPMPQMPMDAPSMTPPVQPADPVMPPAPAPMTPPTPVEPPQPVTPPAPVAMDTPAMSQPTPPTPAPVPTTPTPQDDALNSILDSLQAKVKEGNPSNTSSQTPQSGTPTIPDPDFKSN